MAQLQQVILRRTGIYPLNSVLASDPVPQHELHQRVRVLAELGMVLSTESQKTLMRMSEHELADLIADWKHLHGGDRGGCAFRKDFDIIEPTLTDTQRYTEQMLHYVTRFMGRREMAKHLCLYTVACPCCDAIWWFANNQPYGDIPDAQVITDFRPYDWQLACERGELSNSERDQREVVLLRGEGRIVPLMCSLFTEIATQNQVYSEFDRADLLTLATHLVFYDALPTLEGAFAFRENLAFLAAAISTDYAHQARTLNEVLRIAVALSNINLLGTEGDLSLSEPSRFKLRRHQRTFIARLINTLCERDYEAACYDTATHAERFKRLARTIHPGEYPSLVYLNVWADALYNGEMRSYESEVDAAYRSCDVDKVTRVLSRRPGVFARQLNRALRYFSGDQQQVADAFCQVAPRVAAPLLVQMHNMYTNIAAGSGQHRLVIDKAGVGSVVPAGSYTQRQLELGLHAVKSGLSGRLSGVRVHVPHDVGSLAMPLGNRNASESLLGLSRYNRVRLDPQAMQAKSPAKNSVIRLFTYWNSPADVDLSVLLYDAKGALLDRVWYGSQRAKKYCYHSGDVTNGTGGAWEFIDLKIAQAREDRVRYAVPTVQLYAGHSGENTLADVNDLFAGFMLLPRVGVGKNVHEVSQVRTKFTLTSRARGSLPLILDLKERTMTITDVGIRSGVNVIESGPVVKAMFELFAHYAPFTVADYLNLTGATVVGEDEEADIVLQPTVASLSQLYRYKGL